MTKKEKKAIEILGWINVNHFFIDTNGSCDYKEVHKALENVLNLIERLQKENEQINNRDIKRLAEIGELRTENSYLKQENEYLNCICESDKDNYINKGKIREKIKELEEEQEEKDTRLDEAGFDLGTRNYLTTIEEKLQLLRELLEEK